MTQQADKTRHTTYMMIQDIVRERVVSATERVPVAGVDFFAYAMDPEALMSEATKAHALAVFDEAAEQSRLIPDLATWRPRCACPHPSRYRSRQTNRPASPRCPCR